MSESPSLVDLLKKIDVGEVHKITIELLEEELEEIFDIDLLDYAESYFSGREKELIEKRIMELQFFMID